MPRWRSSCKASPPLKQLMIPVSQELYCNDLQNAPSSFSKSAAVLRGPSLTPYPCRLASIDFHESSRSFVASKTPSWLTPTCAICLKEFTEGDEIDLSEIEPALDKDLDCDDLFLPDLVHFAFLGGPTRSRRWLNRRWVKCVHILLTTVIDLVHDFLREHGRLIVVIKQETVSTCLDGLC